MHPHLRSVLPPASSTCRKYVVVGFRSAPLRTRGASSASLRPFPRHTPSAPAASLVGEHAEARAEERDRLCKREVRRRRLGHVVHEHPHRAAVATPCLDAARWQHRGEIEASRQRLCVQQLGSRHRPDVAGADQLARYKRSRSVRQSKPIGFSVSRIDRQARQVATGLDISPNVRNALASNVLVIPCMTTIFTCPTHVWLRRGEGAEPSGPLLSARRPRGRRAPQRRAASPSILRWRGRSPSMCPMPKRARTSTAMPT